MCKCGNDEYFLYGKKNALCLNEDCRQKVPRPAHGYVGKDGKVKVFILYHCKNCEKMFCIGEESTKPAEPCPRCRSIHTEQTDRW